MKEHGDTKEYSDTKEFSDTHETNQKKSQKKSEPQMNENNGSPKYWLSLEQWKDDPEFQALATKEFMSSPLAEPSTGEGKEGGWARREFLKLMGASMALSTFGCVRRPAQKIVPYAQRPVELTPGLANYYASTVVDGHAGYGVVVTTREGRPIKIEGNTEHPLNNGGMWSRAHAQVLSLYDPDRTSGAKQNLLNDERTNRETINISWEQLDKEVTEQLKKGSVAVLTGPVASPSQRDVLDRFSRAVGAKQYVWEPLNLGDVVEGQKQSYGSTVLPVYDFSKAEYIVSVGADFLGTYINPAAYTHQYARSRKLDKEMSKLVVFEGNYSLTGANADERYRVRASQMIDVLMGLSYELVYGLNLASQPVSTSARNRLKAYAGTAERLGLDSKKFQLIAKGLWEKRGKSLVIAGGINAQMNEQQATALQVAANYVNDLLSNDGKTVFSQGLGNWLPSGSHGELARLVEEMNSGKVKTLIIHNINPIYSAPDALKLVEALRKVETVIYAGDRNDETGLVSHYLATDDHPMEKWGDGEALPGVYSIQQPTIRPINDTRAFEEGLIAWAKALGKASGRLASDSWYDYVKSYWRDDIYSPNRRLAAGGFEEFWIELLQKGVFDTTNGGWSNRSDRARSFRESSLELIPEPRQNAIQGYELALYATVGLKDGTLANVSWLQEFPDPVTKICWDNYLCVSPKTAQKHGLREESLVKLTANGHTLKLPVHVQPGQHDDVLGLAVGYGRTAAGKIANNIGVNAFRLAGYKKGQGFSYISSVEKIEKANGRYRLANVQGHHSMEGREIIIEASLQQYKKNPAANVPHKELITLWSPHKYPGHKWGMGVDLNSCTGCGACVIACQSENSVPTVGKRYILEGREMHWMRIDRYYAGNPEDPDSLHMPVMCQHCDNAPCETVCPVIATVHGEEGTNDMIYNRCVGTRYCANNCPYKVRRFNWFNFVDGVQSPLHMAMNPDVTVRSRGVMEKCTFCIHRIKETKQRAKVEQRELKDGDVKSACQQSCPANAIVFGDLNDPESEVAKWHKSQRGYGLLAELNNLPNVKYLSKIRNTDKLKTTPSGHGHKKEDQPHGGGEEHKSGDHS